MVDLEDRLGIAWSVAWAHLIVLGVMLLPQIGAPMRLFGAGLAHITSFGSENGSGAGLTLHLLALAGTATLLYLWAQGGDRLSLAFLAAGAVNLLIAPVGLAPAILFFWLARRPDLLEATERMPVIGGAAKTRLFVAWALAVALLLVVNIPILFLVEVMVLAWLPATIATALIPGALTWWLMHRPLEKNTISAMPQLPGLR